MDNVSTNQIAGLLRALGPIAVGLLIKWGLPEAAAGPLVEWGIMVLAGFVAAAWSWMSNRAPEVAKRAASITGVRVEVSKEAEPELKAVAADPAHPDVILKPLATGKKK